MQRLIQFFKSTFKMDYALVGAIISVLGIISSYLYQRQQNEETQQTNKNLQAIIIEQAEKLQAMADRQKENSSWGQLRFSENPYGGCEVQFEQQDKSKPMFSVKINIFEKMEPGARYLKNPDFTIEETSPNVPFTYLGNIKLKLDWEKTLYIKFTARHREWTQLHQYKKYSDPTPELGGRARTHVKIFEGFGVEGKVLYDDGIRL